MNDADKIKSVILDVGFYYELFGRDYPHPRQVFAGINTEPEGSYELAVDAGFLLRVSLEDMPEEANAPQSAIIARRKLQGDESRPAVGYVMTAAGWSFYESICP